MVSRRVVRVAVPGFAPFSLAVHPPGELVSDHLAANAAWEPFESSCLRRLTGPGDWVLDVGANLGYYTRLAAQRIGPQGRVLAFEPDAANFALLQANSAGLPQVEPRQAALGDAGGTASISTNPTNRGDLYLLPGAGTGDVPVLRGDDLDLPRLDLLKVDVQGAEVSVLRGLRRTIARSRDAVSVLIEAWPFGLERFGDSALALLDELLDLDLPVYRLDHERGRLLPLSEGALSLLLCEELDVAHQGFVNLLLTHRLGDDI